MRVVLMSDTHGLHRQVNIPDGDVLIHAGDACMEGTWSEFADFAVWFAKQPHPHKVFVPGNHDRWCERVGSLVMQEFCDQFAVSYLVDRGVDICGLKVYGSPWVPNLYNWAFYGGSDGNEDVAPETFRGIPGNLDILVTHGGPSGILDAAPNAYHLGSKHLLEAVKRKRPKVHVFGHIHHGYGESLIEHGMVGEDFQGETRFFNVSVCDEAYDAVNAPRVVTFNYSVASFT